MKTELVVAASIFAVSLALTLAGIWLYEWDAISWGFLGLILSSGAMYILTED